MPFIIQSSCKSITDKISNIDHDFILNCKILYMMLAIYLLDHITLSFYEVVTSNWEYPIHDFNNLHNRMNLKPLLHCDDLCGIRIKEHAEAETFIKVKWYHFDELVDSIVISEFNYWQSADLVILQMIHIKVKPDFDLLIEVFHLAVSLRVMGYWNQRIDVQLFQ